jgi:penicillin-binding protein 1A
MDQQQEPDKKVTFQKMEAHAPPEYKGVKGKRFLILFFLAILFTSCLTGMGLKFLHHMYQTLPEPVELSDIQPSLVSKVLAMDGSLVHEFSVERRFWVPLHDIPRELQQAVVSIEDRRFYKHWGIDIKRIMGAIVVDVIKGKFAQGASTLTQQLARNVYLTSRQSLIRKVREAMTAVQLESYYTKDEILELYLNMVYIGAGVYGVEAASQRYFSKPVTDLTLNECSVLAGCIQLPEYYRPDREKNIKRITKRRNSVIRGMKKMGFIPSNVAKATISDTIPSNPQKLISKKAPYFVETVRQYMEKKYGEYLLYNGGLTIHTTVDPVAQDSTDQAVPYFQDSLQRRTNRMFLDSSLVYEKLGIAKIDYLNNFDSIYAVHKDEYKDLPDSVKLRIVQVSVVALDVKTGAVRVLTGGRDFSESKFNRALQARRQPGSAFKPFVYTVALDSSFTPATIVMDQPITLETPEGLWRPENYDQEFYGPVTVRHALKKSINLVAIQILQDVGAKNIITYARKAGLKHRLNPVPALAIGACEVTNLEITSAYSIYPHHGWQATPYFIEKVYDKNGRLLEKHVPEKKMILSPQTAYLMTSLMVTVVRNGTGAQVGARGFNRPAGGKTGTTNDYSDAWFIGFTPQIACGVWVGVDERRSMGRGVTGSKGAIPIWVSTMKALHKKLPVKGFGQPSGIACENICNKTHKLATRYCPDVAPEYFKGDNVPETCDEHVLKGSKGRKSVIKRLGTQKKSSIKKMKKGKKSLIF